MADTFEEARLDLVDLQYHRYRDSNLQSHYHRNRGLLVIPVMGPAGIPPVIARVHAPYGLREVEFSYAKSGGPPLMPAAANTSSGDTILAEDLAFQAPVPDQNGRLLFATSGRYTYVQPLEGRGPDSLFPIDAHPFPSQVDALGEIQLADVESLSDLATFGDQVINGVWNRTVIDGRMLSAYRIIG